MGCQGHEDDTYRTVGVGGPDTARGISFQSAQAVAACLYALESPEVEMLRVEGVDDVVDFELCGAAGRRLRVCQAKTRKEPYVWAPADVVAIIERWQELDNADDAQFEFLTDGSAGPELADRFQPALRRARMGQLTNADHEFLASKGLSGVDASVLARVVIESRQPDADAVLDRVSLRLLRLLELGAGDSSTAHAEALVNALFRLVSLKAGNDDPDARVITRLELSDLVAIPLAVIDGAHAWDATARASYTDALRGEPPHPSFVGLEAAPNPLKPEALALVVREHAVAPETTIPVPAVDVLHGAGGAILSGAPGSGKSTTLELLVPAAMDRGLCPVAVSAESFEAGSLRRLVRDALERRLGYQLAPRAVADCLNDEGAVLLVDGAGELEREVREGLLFELHQIRRSHAGLRTIVTSRDPARLRVLGLPSFVLQGLTPDLRRRVAAELLDQGQEHLVDEVESRLGDLVDSPLLFVMALSLAKTGVHARSRAELFERFVEGLSARRGGEAMSELVLALVRDTCFTLREADQYSADPWTWRRLIAAALVRLAEQRLFDADAISADDALELAQTAGLLRVVPGSDVISLTHDLFCDFFAAEAVRLGQRDLPDNIDEPLEELTVFLAERGALDANMTRRVAANPVAAARCASASPLAATLSESDVTGLLAQLTEHLGPSSQAGLANAHVRATELDGGVYVFALPPGALASGTTLDPQAAADTALLIARVPSGSSSLAAAVALWLAALRWALGDRDSGPLLPIPSRREDLPAALEEAFSLRRQEVEELCTDACPSLLERVQRSLNLRGFHAIVLPAQTYAIPIAGQEELTMHPCVFSFNAADISVRLADQVDEDFIEDPRTQANCEDWLRAAPSEAARADLKNALARLLPGLT
jgi:hypothetical protein